MNQDDIDRDKKQTLLQEEIVDKDFEPQEFQEYCEKIMGEESNIDSLTYQEIFDMITQFQKEKVKSPPSSPESARFDFDFSTQPFEQKLDPLFDLPESSSKQTDLQQFGDFMQEEIQKSPKIQDVVIQHIKSFEKENAMQLKYECKKLGQGILSHGENVDIKIISFENVAGKLLQSSYVVYNICTTPLDWNVQRRFSEFVWLRNTLLKIYPGIVVPTLTEKSIQKSSQLLLNKRRVSMEYFLMEIFKTPEFRNSKYFVDFLKSDNKQFKQVMRDSEKVSRPEKFQNLINMSGHVRLKLDSNVRQQSTSFEALLNFQEPIYNKIKQTLRQLEQEFEALGKRLLELGEHFVQLSKIAEKYDFTNSYRSISSQDIYKILNNYAKIQSEEMISRSNIINVELVNFFRFHQLNINSFKDIHKLRNHIALEVEKKKDIKEETFAEDIINSFDKKINREKEFIDTPSKNSDILREQLAFYNWKLEDEAIKFQNRKIISYSEHFSQCSTKLNQIISKTSSKLNLIKLDLNYIEQMDFQSKTATLVNLLELY